MPCHQRHRGLLMFAVCAIQVLLWRSVRSGYVPESTQYTSVLYNDTNPNSLDPVHKFPDSEDAPCTLPSGVSYFISELNFEAQNGKILIGAANKLYLLDETNLNCLGEYVWDPSDNDEARCSTDNMGDDQARTCQNHIRVYKNIPTDTSMVLVCGTQASISPQCRIVQISGNDLTGEQDPVPAADAVVSYYPEFAGFGEFNDIGATATSYFGVGFFQGDRGVGRDYQMGFYDVAANPLSVNETTATVVSEEWLKSPVTFIDFYRADYAPPTPEALAAAGNFGQQPRPNDYKFYFVFIRENTAASGTEVIYSQVVRICRNDPGINGRFSTYEKARISCMIEVPPGREFIGANDYIYNNIDSVAFNEAGRFGENEDWFKSMYGAFSGPRIGPEGTAICVYPAYNSRETDSTAMFNRGIFDIFREDLTMGTMERQNNFVECDPNGRSLADSDWIDIIQDVKQIGSNPLLVIDGITVTKMVVDSVCVVRSTDPNSCVNQDVLFLGTDKGKVIKVVFATTTENNRLTTDPVFAEEISLENRERVRALRIETVGSVKRIFVSTESQVYQLPTERCFRFETCSSCVGSRDPYCVWNNNNNACEKSPLSAVNEASGTVPTGIWQDIHDGAVDNCMTVPECSVTATVLGSGTFTCHARCNSGTASVTFSVSDNSLTSGICPSTTDQALNNGAACAMFSGGLGLHNYQCSVATRRTDSTPGPVFTASVTTAPGPPAEVSDNEVFITCTQTNVTVCVQLSTFTDFFENYNFTVMYGSTNSLGNTSPVQTLYTDNCITISPLSAGSTLYYQVNIINSQGTMSSSIRRHQLLEDVPGRPPVPTVVMTTGTTVTISWSAPSVSNGVITGYAVMVNNEEEISCVLHGTTLTYTVDGLSPYTEYRFSVAACTSAGEGNASPEVTARTDCAAPGPVGSITFPSITSASITAEWTQPADVNGDPSALNYEYEFVCYDLYDGPSSPLSTSSSNTTFVIASLDPLTYCCVTVRAHHNVGPDCTDTARGPLTQTCAQTTDVTPGPVQDLTVQAFSPTALFATWSPPANYQRPDLQYSLMLDPGNGMTYTVDGTSQYIDTLQPSTNYTVTIFASANGINGPQISMPVTTLDDPPDPPTDVSLSQTATDLSLTWTAPTGPVTGYEAFLQCNDMNFSIDSLPKSQTFSTFDVSSVSGHAWCTAVVQTRNSVGTSLYSSRTSIILNDTPPSKPKCFFNGNTGSVTSISFTVTYPFSLNQLYFEWQLYDINTGSSQNGTRSFSPLIDDNIVYVTVERKKTYEFELRMCNPIDCSEYCDRTTFITETTVPFFPESIFNTNTDCCSARLNWTLPPSESENSVVYTIQLGSSCSSVDRLISNISGRSYYFTDLCPNTNYTVSIRATETQTDIMASGMFSPPFTFRTLAAPPSPPRDLKVIFAGSSAKIERLTILWGVPEEPNGKIVGYEIHWSNSGPLATCDKPDLMFQVFQDTVFDATEYKTSNVTNLNSDEKSILVCVRAILMEQEGLKGEWASYSDYTAATGALAGSNPVETCTNLIIVAVIACVAVLSSIILGVVLILVVCYNGWAPCKERREHHEGKDLEDCAKNKPPMRPNYNKSSSISSTAPMLGRNGSVSS